MTKLIMGCGLATMVALSAKSEARPPALFRSGSGAPVVPLAGSKLGLASWYGEEFQGSPTASGEMFDMNRLTAAHRSYPLGTRIKVTNLTNQRWVVLRVNDRGPNIAGRLLDVSRAGAKRLGFLGTGIALVTINVITCPRATSP